MKKNIYYILILILLYSINGYSQIKNKGIPYITNYTRDEYKAAAQNWSITQDKRGVIYIANALGVLEFEGQKWNLIPINGAYSYSLNINKKGRIFVGAKGEFGYLAPDSIGKLHFVSLVNKIEKIKERSISVIGKVLISNDIVYFVARGKIFEYSNDKIRIIKDKNLHQVFEVNNRIFVRIKERGLVEYKEEKFVDIEGGSQFAKSPISNILPYNTNKLIIISNYYKDGIFVLNKQKIKKLKNRKYAELHQQRINSAIKLKDGNYALGLFSAGLIIIDKTGKIIHHYNTNTGLQNDKVIKVFQDKRNNIWLALQNGISTVLSSLPISLFDNKYNLNNTSYSSIVFENKLYVGNSSGIYYKSWGNFENHLIKNEEFKKIGDPNEVWDLDTINGYLLCATKGISIFKGKKKVKKLKFDNSNNTAWRILKFSNNSNHIIVGTSKGLMLIEYKPAKKSKKDGKWILKHKIKGFTEKCRHIQIDNEDNIWYSDDKQGVCKLILNEKLDSVTPVWYYGDKGVVNKENNRVFKINNKILIGTETGIFEYDKNTDKFVENKELNKIIEPNVRVTLMKEDKIGNIWFKQEKKDKNKLIFELGQIEKQAEGFYLNKTQFLKFKNNIHSISLLNETEILIGTEKGFIHYDSKVNKDYYEPYNTLIRKIEFISNDSLIFAGNYSDSSNYVTLKQDKNKILIIPFMFNDIRFTFSSPYFDEPENIQFKFFLEGNDDDWSDWKNKNFKEYSNLSEGDYIFHVKAKNIYEQESVEATYTFTINPPWYRTIWAMLLYLFSAIFLVFSIVRLSVRRLRLQKEYLEQQVKERTKKIQLQNTELNQQKEEIEAQNDMLFESNEQIQAKNKSITASINYAKRIQEAMLPIKDKITEAIPFNFILFKPRDIVSGDFYWFAEKKGKTIIAAVDCTGHGVPGAFMSMIGSEILTTILTKDITKPSKILDLKNSYVQKALKQEQTDNQDGMDMTLCTINKDKKIVEFAGAKNPLLYIQNGELFQIKGDSQSIGGRKTSRDKPFENHEISYAEHTTYFYTFSDGYQDQFGGPRNRKYMIKRMKKLILDNYQKPFKEQEQILNSSIEEWMKDVEQTDDILVIGFKLEP